MIKAKIRVYNGEDDKMNPPETVDKFMQEMRDAKADFQFINYPGVIHSFTNPDADELAKKFELPLGYNAEADKEIMGRYDQLLCRGLQKITARSNTGVE